MIEIVHREANPVINAWRGRQGDERVGSIVVIQEHHYISRGGILYNDVRDTVGIEVGHTNCPRPNTGFGPTEVGLKRSIAHTEKNVDSI